MASGPPAKAVRPPIGNYQILAHVATGGMGAVYKAVDSRLGREVALKVLLPDQAAQKPLLLKRFRLEARYGGQLNHENIVTLYEYGEIHGIHFLALEYVDGVSLLEYMAHRGKLDVEESRQIIIQATRAIAHLHKHGIIHRDIKPSNFLVAQRKGRPFIKLVDLGLARRVTDEGPRVTLAGTTLGTVDYLAPEQARDSGAADVRSDIYSLGCTWYHMLSGRPPFAEGTVADRIYKHVTMPPPDIRKSNPSVSAEVTDILGRMLEKNPADRYQTPEQLLLALEGEQAAEKESDAEIPPAVPAAGPGDLLDNLAGEEDAVAAARKRRAARREFLDYERKREESRFVPKSVTRRQERKFWAIGAGAIGAVLLCVLAMVYLQSSPTRDVAISSSESTPGMGLRGLVDSEPESSARSPEPIPEPTRPPPEAALPPPSPLYQPTVPINSADLQDTFERPWRNLTAPLSAPVLHVSHQPQKGGPPQFRSLAAALGAAAAGQETIVEIDDNGPLFTPPLTLKGRSLTLRAGKGFRPLIAWDLRGAARDPASRLLGFADGNLRLENIDVVAKTIDSHQAERSALFQVANGSFQAKSCTFSLAGNHAQGVAVVRLEGAQSSGACRCRLDNCLVRGAEAILLEIRAPGAEVLVKDCLVVGGRRPLFDVGPSYATDPITVRVWRSTFLADRRFLQVRSGAAASAAVSFHWLGWDTLIAREGIEPSGDLIALLDRAVPGNMHWETTNCLYTGWSALLTTPTQRVSDLDSWHAIWHLAEGDAAMAETWPAVVYPDPAEVDCRDFQTARTAVYYAATSRAGALGCDVTMLPPPRRWIALIR
jgi:eukaryotic-like serine/threonine-protein kinase